MERSILTFTPASSTPPGPGAAAPAFLRYSASPFSHSHDNCGRFFSNSPASNSRITISDRGRGNLSLKALNHRITSNWDVSNYAAPSWLPRFEELDTTNMLLSQRIVFLGSPIDDMTADFIISQLLLLDSQDNTKDIRLFINSPGGSTTAGMAVYDAMKLCKADISTICMGFAASMAAFVLASGTKGKRFCMPNARVMIGQAETVNGGGLTDMSIRIRENLYQSIKMNKILSRITGKTEKQIEKDTQFDYFMNPWEAKEYGLVDVVIDDGKPGLVAPIFDAPPEPKTIMNPHWKLEGRFPFKDILPSEENLFPENRGLEQKEGAPLPMLPKTPTLP